MTLAIDLNLTTGEKRIAAMKEESDKFKNPEFLREFGIYKFPLSPHGSWPLAKNKVLCAINFAIAMFMLVMEKFVTK